MLVFIPILIFVALVVVAAGSKSSRRVISGRLNVLAATPKPCIQA